MTDKVIGRAVINIYPSLRNFQKAVQSQKNTIANAFSGVDIGKQLAKNLKANPLADLANSLDIGKAVKLDSLKADMQKITYYSKLIGKQTKQAFSETFPPTTTAVKNYVDTLKAPSTQLVSSVGSAFSRIGTTLAPHFQNAFTLAGNIATKTLATTGAAVGAVFVSNLSGAVARHDTFLNFDKVMGIRGIGATASRRIISELDDGLRGLPIALDDASTTFRQLYTTMEQSGTGATKAKNLTLALSKGLVGTGANAQQVSGSLEQLRQGFARGQFYMQDWKIVMANSPEILDLAAKHMLGLESNSYDLYDALQDGTVSVDDFQDALIELSPTFDSMAKAMSGGIGVGLTNLGTQTKRTISNFLGLLPVRPIIDKVTDGVRDLGTAFDLMKPPDERLKESTNILNDFARDAGAGALDAEALANKLNGLVEKMDAEGISTGNAGVEMLNLVDSLKDGSISAEEAGQAIQSLKTDIDSNQVGLSNLSPRMQDFVERGRELKEQFSNLDANKFFDSVKSALPAVGTLAGALGALAGLAGTGGVLGALGTLGSTLGGVLGKIPLLGGALSGLAGPAGIVISVFTGLMTHSEAFRESIGTLGSKVFDAFSSLDLSPLFDAFSTVFKVLGDTLAPVIDILGNFIGDIMPALSSVMQLPISLLKILTEVLKGIAPIVTTVASSIASVAIPVFNVLSGVIGVVGKVAEWLAKLLARVFEKIQPLFEGISSAISGVADFVGGAVGKIGKWLGIVDNDVSATSEKLDNFTKDRDITLGVKTEADTASLNQTATDIFNALSKSTGISEFEQLGQHMVDGMAQTIANGKPTVQDALNYINARKLAEEQGMIEQFNELAQQIPETMRAQFERASQSGAISGALTDAVLGQELEQRQKAYDRAVSMAKAVQEAFLGSFGGGSVDATANAVIGSTDEAYASRGASAGTSYADAVRAQMLGLSSDGSVPEWASEWAERASDRAGAGGTSSGVKFGASLSSSISKQNTQVSNASRAVLTSAKSTASNVSTYSVGQSFSSGIVRGMGSMLGTITSTASSLVQRAVSAAKATAEVNSPSKLFAREVGSPIAEGLAYGIEKNAGFVDDAIGSVIGDASNVKATVGWTDFVADSGISSGRVSAGGVVNYNNFEIKNDNPELVAQLVINRLNRSVRR